MTEQEILALLQRADIIVKELDVKIKFDVARMVKSYKVKEQELPEELLALLRDMENDII